MQKTLSSLAACFLLSTAFSQEMPIDFQPGTSEVPSEKGECLSPEDRAAIENMLVANITELKKQGVLPETPQQKSMIVAFDWPLRKTSGLTSYASYYATNNFLDQNFSSGLLDYNCGTRVYNGHLGTDIDTWPFPWYLYNNNFVEVIAGFGGVIIGKTDGNDDDHCSCSGNWNAVFVQHADGSVAWYGHLKKNSLTTKSVGQSVAKGEYLGVVASSGCSTQPHLHFEVYKALPYNTSNLIDPYQGSCNSLNTQSWWAVQRPYIEPTLNALLTHSAVPVMGCPGVNEDPKLSNSFAPGAKVYTAAYYHDQQSGHQTNYRIRRPDNSIWQSWSHNAPSSYVKSWWYWSWTLPPDGPFGTWTFEADYQGQSIVHPFTFGVAPACTSLSSPANGAINVPVSASLSWPAAANNPSGYRLSIGTTPGGTQILNNADLGNVTSFDPPGNLPANTTIYVNITPYNAIGNASGCVGQSFTTSVCIPNLVIETNPLSAGIYRASGSLTALNLSVAPNAVVTFTAETGILLQQDFTVPSGAVFDVYYWGCP